MPELQRIVNTHQRDGYVIETWQTYVVRDRPWWCFAVVVGEGENENVVFQDRVDDLDENRAIREAETLVRLYGLRD